MINLLPPDIKTGYIFARRNVVLRKWVVAFVVALVGLGVIGTYGLLALHQSSSDYSRRISQTEATFKKEKYAETQKKVEDISSSFKLVVKVLGQEVLFSQLIKQIGAAMPLNANLTGLNISQTQGAIDISAVATDYQTATQVQVNLADPANKIFSKADIVNIACNSTATTTGTSSKYPCSISLRALFATNNPFLLINSKGTTP